ALYRADVLAGADPDQVVARGQAAQHVGDERADRGADDVAGSLGAEPVDKRSRRDDPQGRKFEHRTPLPDSPLGSANRLPEPKNSCSRERCANSLSVPDPIRPTAAASKIRRPPNIEEAPVPSGTGASLVDSGYRGTSTPGTCRARGTRPY